MLLIQGDTVSRKPPEVKFTGDVGFVSTAGNTSVQTLNLGDKLSIRYGDVTLAQQFALVYGESKGIAVTSNWRGSLRGDVAIGKRLGVYGSINYERNTFAGLASRIGNVIGMTAPWIKNDRDVLTVELGVSVTAQRGIPPRGRDSDFMGGRAAGNYIHKFTSKASIAQSVEFLPNFRESRDLRVNTETLFLAPITKEIGVRLSYVIRYDGLPEEGYQTTDKLFTSGLQVTL
jgi:putative salt-induced outer membrane protein